MLTIEGKQFGRNTPAIITTIPSLESASTTLRQIIAHVVSAEVAAFQERQQKQSIFRVLTAAEINVGAAQGKVNPSGREAKSANVETATKTAILAFRDGLFFAFVDGAQVETLDEPVAIGADSTITFLRLVALAGG